METKEFTDYFVQVRSDDGAWYTVAIVATEDEAITLSRKLTRDARKTGRVYRPIQEQTVTIRKEIHDGKD